MLSAILEVSVLVEACTGWREKNYIARRGMLARVGDGALHVGGRHDRGRAFERGRDTAGGGADGQDGASLLGDEFAHALELARLVLAAEDQPDARRRKRLQRLERGIDVRPFRIVDPADAVQFTHEDHTMG